MVIVTYDEFGGQWDHVPPPGQGGAPGPHDQWGPGRESPRSSSRPSCAETSSSTTRATTRHRCSRRSSSASGSTRWPRATRRSTASPTRSSSTASTATAPPVDGGVSGTVPATLSLALGAPASFGPFTPGITKTYEASTTATITSTAGDATLSVADPSPNATGHLVNGAFSLPQPLQARARNAANSGTAYNNVGSSASPLNLLTYDGPVSNDQVTLQFSQLINANDALRTGTYSKTLTFTLSTTTP